VVCDVLKEPVDLRLRGLKAVRRAFFMVLEPLK
jgi:hypothetical protein